MLNNRSVWRLVRDHSPRTALDSGEICPHAGRMFSQPTSAQSAALARLAESLRAPQPAAEPFSVSDKGPVPAATEKPDSEPHSASDGHLYPACPSNRPPPGFPAADAGADVDIERMWRDPGSEPERITPVRARHLEFARQYVIDYSPGRAAISAGYRAVSAYATGRRLLNLPDVQEEIARLECEHMADLNAARAAAWAANARIAHSDVRRCFDPDTGQPLMPHQLDDATAVALKKAKMDLVKGSVEYEFHAKQPAIDRILTIAPAIDVAAKEQGDQQEETPEILDRAHLEKMRARLRGDVG